MDFLQNQKMTINWVGHIDVWPARDCDWENSRAQLFERYQEWSKAIARKIYSRSLGKDLELKDMEQYASIGLLEAIERYEPSFGVPFKSFAKKRIRGEVLNHLYRFSESANQYQCKKQILEERLEKLQLADSSKSPAEAIIDNIVELAVGFLLEHDDAHNSEMVLNGQRYNTVEFAHLHTRIWHYMDCLTDVEREILDMHYQKINSFSDIAMHLNLTVGRVSQLHKQALKKLRHKLSWV
ncbi:sigma-70 family RNA polymerase sigma factor [Paraneptunicella aestuarii]|uniref:sigma-70 family RNA polymerase sigma factor n=1 Tax=Paraneptunicella aestuarii TaxID=2831148 RepID=UPI001E60616B|nr:sigma-70 family RNA polymerase sigma factor [Paraneptunicella aestuarii]UAA37580.1 sigma-70 family RNA polymerase sigma factor [Paraneptunicella aestuarii]